ncbi:MAG: hypothetical protein IJ772_04380 [Bacilli bacterium]|nr:hypothetical protein [Bacilli bacterium]
MNKMIKKIAKEATKEIIANLDEGGWFRETTQDEIDDYKRGLKKTY